MTTAEPLVGNRLRSLVIQQADLADQIVAAGYRDPCIDSIRRVLAWALGETDETPYTLRPATPMTRRALADEWRQVRLLTPEWRPSWMPALSADTERRYEGLWWALDWLAQPGHEAVPGPLVRATPAAVAS